MQRLKVEASAPDINTNDVFGKTISYDSFTSPYLLVAFLRYAGCPYCNLSIHRLAMEHALLLDSGCDVLAFIQSDKSQIDKNIYRRHKKRPEFSIIADRERKYYQKFAVTPRYKKSVEIIRDIPYWLHAVKDHGFAQGKVDGNLLMAPALFLIHRNTKKIIIADYMSDLFKHETFSPIYDKILTHQN